MLSEEEEEEEEEGNIKSDDDEPEAEPVSAEAVELLKTEKIFKTGYLLKKGEKRRVKDEMIFKKVLTDYY